MYRSRTTLEVGFDAAPGTLTPLWSNTGFTWTDISSALVEYNWDEGSVEFDGVTPGAGNLVLENLTGTFDPSNAGGTYYPNLTSGKPFRIREQLNLLGFDMANGNTLTGLALVGTPTVTVSTAQHRHGATSLRITNGAGTIGFDTPTGTAAAPCYPGEPITGSVWVMRTSATGRTATASLRFYTAAGAFISATAGTPITTTAAFQQAFATALAPATAAYVSVRIELAGAVVGDTHHVDDLHIVPSDRDGHLTWYPGGPIDVARGVIRSWRPIQQHPGYSTTLCELAGTLTLLAQEHYLDSMWATMVDRSAPTLWYRLSDTDQKNGATDSTGNGYHGTYGGAGIVFSDGLIANDSNAAVNFNAAALQFIEAPGSLAWSSGDYTMAFWMQAEPGASACTLVDTSRVTITMTAGGALSANVLGLVATTATNDFRDSHPHLVWLVVHAAGSIELYVDGSTVATNSGIYGAERLNLRFYLGRDQANTPAQYATIKIDEFVLWQGQLLDPTWFYIAGVAGNVKAADTIGALAPIDVANWLLDPYATATPTGDALPRLNSITMSGALDMLNTCATTGRLVVREAPDGTITIEDAIYVPYQYNGTFVDPITIGQGAGEYGYLGEPTIDYGEASVINELTITRPDRSDIVMRNQASIDARGTMPATVTLWSTEDRYARDVANWLLAQYSAEGRRITGIRPNTARVDGAQAMLWTAIGDVIVVKDHTVDGRTITTTVRVCGKHTAKAPERAGSPPSLVVTLDLSPIRIQPMVLDTSTYGVLGAAANVGKWGP